MPNTLIIHGASITDTSFTLDVEGFPEIVWNVTRMEHDAFQGKFGEPHVVPFSTVAMGGPRTTDPWQNLDQLKVQRFIQHSEIVHVTRWGKAYKLLDLPGIAVMLPHPNGINTCVFPVDGNHRAKAREIIGRESFIQFVVPLRMEKDYRVTFETR